jgi:cytochrome c oxidase subunit I
MYYLLSKPHKLFAYLALVILIVQYLKTWIAGDTAIDIPLHDTYLVINTKHIGILYCIVILVFSFIYKIGEKCGFIYNRGITFSHVFSIILLIILSIYNIGLPPKRYYSFETFDAFKGAVLINFFITILVFINLTPFVLNLVLGFLNRNK